MLGPPTGFWGKLEKDDLGTVVAWHPLAHHCADVAACAVALLESTILGLRLAQLAGLPEFDEAQRQRLGVLAALHDVGKYSIGFQNKAGRGLPTCGHLREVLALCGSGYAEEGRLADALDIDTLGSWGERPDTFLRLLVASVSHHGRPIPVGENPQASWWQPSAGLDPFDGIADLVERSRRWFPAAFHTNGRKLPAVAAFQHGLSGLLMLADWLGSDKRFFPFSEDEEDLRFPWSRERAAALLREMGMDPVTARQSLGANPPGLDRVTHFAEPRPAQLAMVALPAPEPGSLVILEAETGSGKTEAALVRYARMFHAGLVDGLYFALPTRTAATQIHERVVAAVARCFASSDERPPVVLAVPGYINVDGRTGKRALTGFEVLWEDDDTERLRFRGWASEHPKRFLAGAVVVGTIDQVLLSGLMVRHAHLRAVALLRHLLVVDEVHASDAYMNRILESVLERHLKSGGHALLMSATLGARARSRFLRITDRERRLPSRVSAENVPYPCLFEAALGGPSTMTVVGRHEAKKDISVVLAPDAEAPERVASRALSAATAGARVLIVRNTVRDCVATQESLESLAGENGARSGILFRCQGVVAPHHARFARTDRHALDRAMEGSFGKKSPSIGCVAVATQTVQQSLDLDADLMITDLCPMDVLLQRLGRLHRHLDRRRAVDFADARVIVLVPAVRDLGRLIRPDGNASGPHGHGTVYEDLRILEATWLALEARDRIVVPDMCRQLVEATTHPEALAQVVAGRDEPWPAHARRVEGEDRARAQLADLNLAAWSTPFGEPEGLFPSGELSRRILTRLGEGDRLARFPEPLPGPFGLMVGELTIPAWLARDVENDAIPQGTEAGADAIGFRFGPHGFTYDRLGLRRETREADPQEDLADA